MISHSDAMIDIETIATSTNAAIITIAAVRFDALNADKAMQTLELLIDVDNAIDVWKLDVDPGTIDWWGKQSKAAQYAAFEKGPRLTLDDALAKLSKFVGGATRLWCQGMNFDPVILDNAYRAVGQPSPWMYYSWRDSRTIMSLFTDLPKKSGTAHNAVDDAIWQAEMVQTCLNRLNVEKLR